MKKMTKETIIRNTVYTAIDGKEFEHEVDCWNYENNYLSKTVTMVDEFGNVISFPNDRLTTDIYGIVFHRTDEKFVRDFLNSYAYNDKTINELSDEELFYKNDEHQIVLIYSDIDKRWINPAYKIKIYSGKLSLMTDFFA